MLNLTVKELIEKLKLYPEDAQVVPADFSLVVYTVIYTKTKGGKSKILATIKLL